MNRLSYSISFIHNYLFIFILLLLLCLSSSCSTTKYVYLPGETKIEYRDTTIYRDSIVYSPVEITKEVVPVMDTLIMETTLAKSISYVDTENKMLRGKLENKKSIVYKTKYEEKIVYRDSVVREPYPVEVEKEVKIKVHPWYEPILVFLSSIFILYLIYKFLKYKYGLFKKI